MATTKITTTKKTVAKKTTAAKKTVTKKTIAKKPSVVGRSTGEKRGTVTRYTGQSRQVAERVTEAEGLSLEKAATHAMQGRFGTGRDRDDALRQAGHSPAAVQREIAKQTAAAKPGVNKLPIPNNRRGSSWT